MKLSQYRAAAGGAGGDSGGEQEQEKLARALLSNTDKEIIFDGLKKLYRKKVRQQSFELRHKTLLVVFLSDSTHLRRIFEIAVRRSWISWGTKLSQNLLLQNRVTVCECMKESHLVIHVSVRCRLHFSIPSQNRSCLSLLRMKGEALSLNYSFHLETFRPQPREAMRKSLPSPSMSPTNSSFAVRVDSKAIVYHYPLPDRQKASALK